MDFLELLLIDELLLQARMEFLDDAEGGGNRWRTGRTIMGGVVAERG
jgi:hypothetical protein